MSQYWYTINLANCGFGNSMKNLFLLFPKDEIVIKTTARNDIKIERFCIRYRFSKSSFCLYMYYHQNIIYLLNHCTCRHLENCTRCGKYLLKWAVIDNCTDTIKWKYDSFGSVYFTKSVFLILKKYDIIFPMWIDSTVSNYGLEVLFCLGQRWNISDLV